MPPDWLVALGVGVLAASGTWATTRLGRVATLERRVSQMESRERRLWLYCRQLIDHIYQDKGRPPPAMPEDIFGEDDK